MEIMKWDCTQWSERFEKQFIKDMKRLLTQPDWLCKWNNFYGTPTEWILEWNTNE